MPLDGQIDIEHQFAHRAQRGGRNAFERALIERLALCPDAEPLEQGGGRFPLCQAFSQGRQESRLAGQGPQQQAFGLTLRAQRGEDACGSGGVASQCGVGEIEQSVAGAVTGGGLDVALGCDIEHAPRWVYSKGLNLADPAAAVPIGMGCKVCERTSCPQRAFPPVGRALEVDERRSTLAPYPVLQRVLSN